MTSTQEDAVLVYPAGGVVRFVGMTAVGAFCVFAGALLVWAAIVGLGSGDLWPTLGGLLLALPASIFMLVAGAVFFRGVFVLLRQLFRREPYFRIDAAGFECARGQVEWRDVNQVIVMVDPGLGRDAQSADQDTQPLLLRLRSSARLVPTTKKYFDSGWFGETRLTPLGLEVEIWMCRDRALEAVHRFHGQTVLSVNRSDL